MNIKKISNIMNFVDFVQKVLSDKVRDHCDLTGKNRGPAHNTCKINVREETKEILYLLYFTIFVTIVAIYFLKN